MASPNGEMHVLREFFEKVSPPSSFTSLIGNRGRTVVFMRARVLHSWVVHIKK